MFEEYDKVIYKWANGWDAIDDRFFDECFVWAVWSRTENGVAIDFKPQ